MLRWTTHYFKKMKAERKMQISIGCDRVLLDFISKTKTNILDQWFSKCGLWDHCTIITWEFVRNATSGSYPRPTESETQGM